VAHPALIKCALHLFPGVKWLGHDHHPLHLVTRLKKEYSCNLLTLWAFIVYYRVDFIFTCVMEYKI
jgi:hypothetical protein